MRNALWAVLVVLAAACAGETGTAEAHGRIDTVVSGLTAEAGVTRIAVAVAPAGVSQDLPYDAASGTFAGTLAVPVGIQTVTATAWAGETAVGDGQATVTVAKDATAAVTIRIFERKPPAPVPDHGPLILAVTASPSTFKAGDATKLDVYAIDPDGDPLAYAWTATCPTGTTGTFGAPTARSTTWTSDAVGTCTLGVTVTARDLTDAATITLTVEEATGAIVVAGTFVPQPRIARIALTAAAGSGEILRTDANASWTVAIAPGERVALSFFWDALPADAQVAPGFSDSCGGSVPEWTTVGNSASGTWQAPPGASVCVLTFTVWNGLTDAFPIAVKVTETAPSGVARPPGTVAVGITVDDTANRAYGDGELEWKGSMAFDAGTWIATFDPSWSGPWAPLYDDGPWTAGGHEPDGAVAGDHRLGAVVFVPVPEWGTQTFEYGLIDRTYEDQLGNGWMWSGPNGTFTVEAGQTADVTAPGMTVAPYGDRDLRLTLDTNAMAPGYDPSVVATKGSAWSWALLGMRDDGTGGDVVPGDGVYTFVLSENIGPGHALAHTGLLASGDRPEFIFTLGGVEYVDWSSWPYQARTAGVRAEVAAPGGAFVPVVVEIAANGNTFVTIP